MKRCRAGVGLGVLAAMLFSPNAHAQGGLDPSFGSDGGLMELFGLSDKSLFITDVASYPAGPHAGEVLLGATDDPVLGRRSPFLIRIEADGSLDANFGEGGVVALRKGRWVGQVAAGPQGDAFFAADDATRNIVRLGHVDAEGVTDESFGTNGQVVIGRGQAPARRGNNADQFRVTDMEVQAMGPDAGKVVLLNNLVNFGLRDVSLRPEIRRYEAGGLLDTAFSDNGKSSVSFEEASQKPFPERLALGADGSAWVAGRAPQGFPDHAGVQHFLDDGSPDPVLTPDTQAGVTYPFTADRFDIALAPDASAAPVLAVDSSAAADLPGSLHLVRISPSGEPDPGFAPGSPFTTSIGGSVVSAAVDAGGRTYVVEDSGEWDFVLRRFLPSGEPDSEFGDGGAVKIWWPELDRPSRIYSGFRPEGIAVSADSQLVIGDVKNGFGLARFSDSTDVDLSPPETAIVSGPDEGSTVTDPRPIFRFRSTEPLVRFECKLKSRSSWSPCVSPFEARRLEDGPVAFRVRAISVYGVPDPTPEVRRFEVDRSPG